MLTQHSFNSITRKLAWCLTLIMAAACSSGSSDSTAENDSTYTDTTSAIPSEVVSDDEGTPEQTANNIIDYFSAEDNAIKKTLETFPPLGAVQSLAYRAIHLRDSCEALHSDYLVTPEDSLVFGPAQEEAYQAILNYKKLMENGAPKDQCPRLLELTRTTGANDSSSYYLPDVAASNFLSHGNFFFLGGAPFIYRMSEGETDVFKDANGNPEIRFVSDVSENTGYFPHSIFQFTNSNIAIDYGRPLRSYDFGPQHIRGIGSLIHTFKREVPAFFITENGLVPCRVVSIDIKLVPENLGCVSDQPVITFGCSKALDHNEILGIYIPLGSTPQMSAHVARPAHNVWTVDLNDDKIPDLAMVSGTTEGISEEFIAECIWFININGEWKIIDAAQQLDCT